MNLNLKIALYVLLGLGMIGFGLGFYSEFKKNTAAAEPDVLTETASPSETNEVPGTLEPVLSAPPDDGMTNAAAATNRQEFSVSETNRTDSLSNAPPAASPLVRSNDSDGTAVSSAVPAKKTGKGRMMAFLGIFLALTIIVGLMAAYDVSQFFGNESVDFLFNEDLKGGYDPEYEEAEQIWANSRPLEAIQLMREYLKRHPREQYVAIRIAEIYEKDLKNHLAAALEYEQVLKHKLQPERWGWAAIHLCNLYIKLDKTDKTIELLRKIVDEYGETAAAKKARRRLALYESMKNEDALLSDADETAPPPTPPSVPPPAPPGPPPPDAGSPSMPRGFRPKK